VLAGIRWAAGLSVAGAPANLNPARIINVSLGSTGSCDAASADTISQVTAAGALVVIAAGNGDGTDNTTGGGPVDSPANCPGAMAILGLRHAGTKVGYSDLGAEIALGAPAGNCPTAGTCLYAINTTANAGTTTPAAYTYTSNGDAIPNLGTSFSAPIVSGIAGLMLAVNGNLKPAQLIKRLQLGAAPFPTSSSDNGGAQACHLPTGSGDYSQAECVCTTSTCGAGMANAPGAVAQALRPIATITAPASYTGNSLVTLQAGGSTAANNHSIAGYAWSVFCGPGALTSAGTATTSILAPPSGSTVVQLTVTDDAGRTDTTMVTLGTTSSSTASTQACVGVAATDPNAAESGADPGVFTITRTGNTTAALTVSLAFSGTATNGADYSALPSSTVIPAGQASVAITVTPIDRSIAGGSRAVILTLLAGSGYSVDTASSATVTIADNDVATSQGSSGGGGGSLDLLALSGLMVLAVRRVLLRRRPGQQLPRCTGG